MPDWLDTFVTVTPWMAWFFAGVGIPWALALLPRQDWRDWATVAGLGLALGPVLGSTWLFLLGTFGRFSFGMALLGTFIIALGGVWVAWRRYRHEAAAVSSDSRAAPPFRALSVALVIMMGLGLLANVWDTAFWPFLRYDTLWTFGYNAKVFMLEKQIPTSMDYYPQLVPLTYTFGTLAWGVFDDHAARAAVPWFLLASVLAAYLLGWRVYQKRLVGMVTAALWLLLPSGLVWSSSGDLEHPMALYFTLATVFFVLAWRAEPHPATNGQTHRSVPTAPVARGRNASQGMIYIWKAMREGNWSAATRYALIAGLMAGAAMWTKPTAGAFVLGVGLVFGIAVVYAWWRRDSEWLAGKFRLVLLTLASAAPLGGMWYGRNVWLGHHWTDLPPRYWQSFAQRSGMQLHWLWLLAGLVAIGLVVKEWKSERRVKNLAVPLVALVLLSMAILPTALSIPEGGWTQETSWGWINGFREPDQRLNLTEGMLLLAGLGLLIWSVWRQVWDRLGQEYQQAILLTTGIGLPFFTVYFWSFSYHYRLVLTVMPLIFAPIAALLVAYLLPIVTHNRLRQWATVAIVVLLCLPALVAATYHTALNTLNDTGRDTDREKYAYGNPALMQLVNVLEIYAETHQRDHLRILAPAENRLGFFFPTWEIDDKTIPTDVDDLQGYDLFVNYAADFLWETYRLIPNQVQAWTKLAWVYPLPDWDKEWSLDGPYGAAMPRVLKPAVQVLDDGKDHYEVFVINVESATTEIVPENPLHEVVFGDAFELLGYDLPTLTFKPGESFTLKLYWRGTIHAPLPKDYSIYVHLRDPETGEVLDQVDGSFMYNLFPTRLLTSGMVFQDRREWRIREDVRPGTAELWIGFYDPVTLVRLPVTVGGVAVGDGVMLEGEITVE